MKHRKIPRKLHISEDAFMLANRRAARQEEIDAHGRQVSFRKVMHRSKKAYDRNKNKKDIPSE